MRKMRWDCGRDGCFNDRKRVGLGLFDDCFPGRIGMTDVDAMVEVNARFLYGEWKSDFVKDCRTPVVVLRGADGGAPG